MGIDESPILWTRFDKQVYFLNQNSPTSHTIQLANMSAQSLIHKSHQSCSKTSAWNNKVCTFVWEQLLLLGSISNCLIPDPSQKWPQRTNRSFQAPLSRGFTCNSTPINWIHILAKTRYSSSKISCWECLISMDRTLSLILQNRQWDSSRAKPRTMIIPFILGRGYSSNDCLKH